MLDPRKEIVRHEIYVWDPFVRVFHWALVAAFALAYLVIEPHVVHVWAGLVVGVLVTTRIVWGFVGPRHARFADFIYAPSTVYCYARDLLQLREHGHYAGHSPGGGYVILAMLAVLAATVASGIAVSAGGITLLAPWHGILADTALGLVFVHIAGVLLRSFVYRQNLVRAQFTGYKRP